MYKLKLYDLDSNQELNQYCINLIKQHNDLFETRKIHDLQMKVHHTLFNLILNLSARQKDDVYNYMLIPQGKSFYSSSQNPNKQYVTFKSVQLAQKILMKEKLINVELSPGYMWRWGDCQKLTSTATLNLSAIIKKNDDMINNLQSISMLFPEYSKDEAVITQSNALTKYFKRRDRNRKIEIKKLKAKKFKTTKDEKRLCKLMDKNYKPNLMHRLGISDIKLTQEKKIPITADKRLTKYNNFLIKNGLGKFQYQQIFGNTRNEYGRCYSSLHQIQKEERQAMYGANYAEIDFQAFTSNLIYMIETGEKFKSKYNCGNDIYADVAIDLLIKRQIIDDQLNIRTHDCDFIIEKSLRFYRKIVKESINRLIASTSEAEGKKAVRMQLLTNNVYYNDCSINFTKRNQGQVYKYFREQNPDIIFIPLDENSIIDIISSTAPLLRKYFFTDFAKITQNIEASTMLDVLEYCVDNNILSLSIHDAIIAPVQFADEIANIMDAKLREQVFAYKYDLVQSQQYSKLLGLFNTPFNILENLIFQNQITNEITT